MPLREIKAKGLSGRTFHAFKDKVGRWLYLIGDRKVTRDEFTSELKNEGPQVIADIVRDDPEIIH